MNDIFNAIAIILCLICWILLIKKFIFNRYASTKTVKAKVVDKFKQDIVSKCSGIFVQKCYIVVFETNDEKLSFAVSEFSYGNYIINKKGMLKYKGDKIISFR